MILRTHLTVVDRIRAIARIRDGILGACNTSKTVVRVRSAWRGIWLGPIVALFVVGSWVHGDEPVAPKPLYRDPVHDGAADPTVIWNPRARQWWMFYTNRRANVPGLEGVRWVHGTRIGIATSDDGGVTWRYGGTDGCEQRRSSIQVTELKYSQNRLTCDRDEPVRIRLPREMERGMGDLRPSRIGCEFQENPTAIDTLEPWFHWISELADPTRRQLSQTAYRILVASSPHILDRGQGDVWDSGKVASAASRFPCYGAPAIQSHTTYCGSTTSIF